MVDRNSKSVDFGLRDTRQIQGGGVAGSGATAKVPFAVGDNQWRDKMFEQLGHTAAATLDKMADVEYSNLYLEGQAKVGLIQSEDEIEGNPLTRDWQVAGYRDTMGKLALADAQAKFGVDIHELRQQGPEKLQEYLSARRAQLTPGLSSMSREARAATSGQLLLQDRAAITQYTQEHQKFIVEQKSQAVATQWGTAMGSLKQFQISEGPLADGKSPAMTEQIRATAGMLVGSIWMDKSLNGSPEVKQKLTFEAMEQALAQDQVGLYEYLMNNPVPDANGGSSTLVNRLNGEQQLKLSNQYRDTMTRTRDQREAFRFLQLADVDSQIKNNTFDGSYSSLVGFLAPMVANKTITADRMGNVVQAYLDNQFKNEKTSAGASAFLRGDYQSLLAAGLDGNSGADALEKTMTRNKMPGPQRLQTWLQAGANGMNEGYKKAGEYLGVSLRQMRSPDGTMLPQHVEIVRSINNQIQSLDASGRDNARVRLLSGLDEPDRMFAERVFGMVNAGKTYDIAVAEATNTETKELAITPSIRAAQSQQTAQEVAKQIDSVEARGLLETAWRGFRQILPGGTAHEDNIIQPLSTMTWKDGIFSDGPTVQWYVQSAKDALTAEVGAVLLTNPSSSGAQVMSVAKANLAARTIETDNGPIFMPKGTDLYAALGVAPGNQAVIGKAIDALLPRTKEDTRYQIKFSNGRLFAQEVDRDGKNVGQVNGMVLEPASIKAKITEQTREQQKQAGEVFGAGTVVKDGDTAIRYNGDNSAAIPNSWMYNFRSNLVKNEGFRAVPYDDLSGKKDTAGNTIKTVGVGVSSHNPHYPKADKDGKISPAELERSFSKASDSAARNGQQMADSLRMQSESAFALMSELSYQSGNGFMRQENNTGRTYRDFVAELQSKDEAKAHAAFKKTAAWYYSRDPKNPDKVTPRQTHYLELISKSMKGQ